VSRNAQLVCVTSPFLPAEVGRGAETIVHEYANWLYSTGQDVLLVAGSPEPRTGIHEGAVPARAVKVFEARRRWPLGIDSASSVVPHLAWQLRRIGPRLSHAIHPADAAAARLAGVPYLVTYEGIALPRSFAGRPALRWLLRYASTGARLIICPSVACASHLEQVYGHRSTVIPNGLDVARFTGLEGVRQPGLILCAATPDDRRKRVEVLVDAFGRLAPGRPEVELALAGYCSEERRTELLARVPEALHSRIIFVGQVDRTELAKWYVRASVTCLPSLNEAFGMVLVESLATGTPVVGSRHGAIPEIIDEEVGALFEADDAAACADALLDALERSGDDAVAEACRRRARSYDWSVIGPQIVELYDKVV